MKNETIYCFTSSDNGKYKIISGIAVMSNGFHRWNFDGGFPPNIYKIVCQELNLRSQGTQASMIGFRPYKDM